jgi:FixJ family two-component response regulator
VLIEDYLIDQSKCQVNSVLTTIVLSHCTKYQEEISLILLDLNLPELGGMELINGMLSHNFEIPIIILTGYTDLR